LTLKKSKKITGTYAFFDQLFCPNISKNSKKAIFGHFWTFFGHFGTFWDILFQKVTLNSLIWTILDDNFREKTKEKRFFLFFIKTEGLVKDHERNIFLLYQFWYFYIILKYVITALFQKNTKKHKKITY
jgi:hypothetical protein